MAEEEKLVAVCPSCRGNIAECGDCGGWLAAIAPKTDAQKLQEVAADALKDTGSAPRLMEGWCAPSEVIYGYLDMPTFLEFPKVQTTRGGIMYPRFRVETLVEKAKKRFLRRQTWRVHVRYWDPEQQRYAHHIMEGFPAENLANNAAEIIKFTIQTINTAYHAEKRQNGVG